MHNSKEIVDHISTNKVFYIITFLLEESILFIYLFYLLVAYIIYQYIDVFLYTVSWRYKTDCLHASIDILFYIMFYINNTLKKH